MSRHSRIPTREDYEAFDGAHGHQKWKRAGPDWACPCCRRTRFEILRWTVRFPRSPNRFEGWMAVLHDHHDHSAPYFSTARPRFPTTTICDQCNAADASAKRSLKLPDDFSFAPHEIAQFVTAAPHAKHSIDLSIAQALYTSVKDLDR